MSRNFLIEWAGDDEDKQAFLSEVTRKPQGIQWVFHIIGTIILPFTILVYLILGLILKAIGKIR